MYKIFFFLAYFENIILPLHLQTRVCKTIMNNISANIKHQGIIDEITDDCIKVRIIQTSACASCKVAGHCNASENKEKIIDVGKCDGHDYRVGDEVVVIASQNSGLFAVLLSSVVPLFLLVVVLFAVMSLTGNEVNAALASLGSLVPYYFIIYMCRDKIRARLSFRVERE